MKVLVVGSGGREHCLAWKIKQSKRVRQVFVAPGNGGTHNGCTNIDIKADDIKELAYFARKNRIDLTVVGPELPLSMGIKEEFDKQGMPLFGPNTFCSRLESSKSFAKEIMALQNVATPKYDVFDNEQVDEALHYIEEMEYPLVIKADGLAAGKGVFICKNRDEAVKAIYENLKNLKFGISSKRIIIEEFIEGNEASFMCIIDGKNILPLETSEDYKKAFDNDRGPNTGGMGAYSPSIFITDEMKEKILQEIFTPMIEGLAITGEYYTGVLYAGLIIRDNRIYVLEFNVRFGDPETQAVLMRLDSDIMDIFEKTMTRSLDKCSPLWSKQRSLCVICASDGYPGSYEKGKKIHGLHGPLPENSTIFHCGTSFMNDSWQTSGGRVLAVTALDDSMSKCRQKAYGIISNIHFDGMQFRKDIGEKAVKS